MFMCINLFCRVILFWLGCEIIKMPKLMVRQREGRGGEGRGEKNGREVTHSLHFISTFLCVWHNTLSLYLINLSVILRYNAEEARNLKAYGELPETGLHQAVRE